MVSRLFRRRRAAIVSVTFTALALVAVVVPLAQGLPDDVPDETWGTNGRVNAIVEVGNVVFLGGNFTEVREDGGAGPGALARNYIAAFDATTGAPLESWDPSLNGEVYALAASADGTKVYVGGAFTSADGLMRSRLVALDAATGAVDAKWRAKTVNGSVRALSVAGNLIYAGGGFTTVGLEERQRLAAFDASSGELDPSWQPAADALVRTLAFSANRIYAGGDFGTVSGHVRRKAVAIDPTGGAVDPNWRPDPGQKVFSLATRDSTVYGAIGGSSNSLSAWDASTGSVRWRKTADGDFQALAVSRGIVYAGGHFNKFDGELRRKLVAVDANTGALRRDWNPKFPHTSATWYGVASLAAYGDTRLVVGGDFDNVTGFRQEHFAQFTGTIGGAVGDTTAPTRPTGLSAKALGGSSVELAWSASTDDDGVAEYRILRDGIQLATTSLPHITDTSVAPNTGYGYRVMAVDFAGNASPASAEESTTTAPPDEVRTFIATEDSYVDTSTPSASNGSASSIRVDADPKHDLLLKFAPSGLAGRRILSAKLRLYNTDESNNGGDFRRLLDSSWNEDTVTWSNAPAGDPCVVSTLDDVFPGTWYEVDVTPLVRGDGAVSVRASSPSSNGAVFSSSEGPTSQAPQLIVTLAAKGASIPASPTFNDGFESGDLSRWGEDAGLAVRRDQPFSGEWAARAKSTGQATYAAGNLRVSEPELYYRLAFKVVRQSASPVSLLKFKTGTGASIMRLFLSAAGKLAARNDVTGVSTHSATSIATGRWYTAQMRVSIRDTASEVEVWLDGVRVDALSKTESLGTAPIGRIQLGDDASGRHYELLYDEAIVDTEAIPDQTPPTAPTGLRVNASRVGAIALAWDAASDDVGVTGYEIYRDGVLLASTGPGTAYIDATVSAGRSYEYVLRASDAAGKRSSASEPVTVTTPDLDTLPPTVPALTPTTAPFDRLALAWTDAAGRSYARVALGRRLRLRGALAGFGEQPLAGATIDVFSRPRYGAGLFLREGSTRTDAMGRFTYLTKPSSSRVLRFEYRGSNSTVLAAREFTLVVPANSSLRTSRRQMGPGGSVVFSGRLRGGRIPPQGKLTVLQMAANRKWRTFASPRTDRRGRWRSRYRLKAASGFRHYRFRLCIPQDGTYPFDSGCSRRVSVAVQGL